MVARQYRSTNVKKELSVRHGFTTSAIISTLIFILTEKNSKWQIVGAYRKMLKNLLRKEIQIVFTAEFHLLIPLLLTRPDRRGNILLTTLELTEQTTLRFAVDHAMRVKEQNC
jgi:hypothetical protein